MGYYRYMKKNNGKIKFPIEIKGEVDFPEFEISENFSTVEPKKRISSEVKEVSKNKNKKCQSNSLM
jgi:hypothetical protein